MHRAQWYKYGLRFAYMYARDGANPCKNRWEKRAGWGDGDYTQCL
ncbi:hypothetical protein [Yinghuangia soli]|nr:hypothetical protein [Yinghuangia soli]